MSAADDSLRSFLKDFSKRVPVLDGVPLPLLDRVPVDVLDTLSITGRVPDIDGSAHDGVTNSTPLLRITHSRPKALLRSRMAR
jgi:hypothetical protein